VGHRFTAILLPALSTAAGHGRFAANIRSSAPGPIPGNDVAGLWMPGDVEIRSVALVVLALFVLIVFFVVVFLFVIVLGEVKHGQWQRLAKEIAFIAHPHAHDIAVLDFHHAKRMAARLQHDDIAWFQFHDLLLGLHDTNRNLAIGHDT